MYKRLQTHIGYRPYIVNLGYPRMMVIGLPIKQDKRQSPHW